MKYTNKYNLPATIVEALQHDDYDYNDKPNTISVSELIDPPKIRQLIKRHLNEIEVDVSENFWIMLGKMAHSALETMNKEDRKIEQRIACPYDHWLVTGKPDIYDMKTKELLDYKVTSVWSYIFANDKPNWTAQLNIYRMLLNDTGFEVSSMKNMLILRDWRKGELQKSSGDYPPIPFAMVEQPMWKLEDTLKFVKERLAIHTKAETVDVNALACTPEERWAKPTTYAVYSKKKDGTWKERADRVFEDEGEATEYMNEARVDVEMRERKGTDTRCTDYCPVAKWCNYWQEKYGVPNEIKGTV